MNPVPRHHLLRGEEPPQPLLLVQLAGHRGRLRGALGRVPHFPDGRDGVPVPQAVPGGRQGRQARAWGGRGQQTAGETRARWFGRRSRTLVMRISFLALRIFSVTFFFFLLFKHILSSVQFNRS